MSTGMRVMMKPTRTLPIIVHIRSRVFMYTCPSEIQGCRINIKNIRNTEEAV